MPIDLFMVFYLDWRKLLLKAEVIQFLDETKAFLNAFSRDLPNPYYTGLEIKLSRLQELATHEAGLSLQICESTASLRFEHSRSSQPDLNFVIIEGHEERTVELLSAVNDCYNFQWVPNRKMYSGLKSFIFKLLRLAICK